MGYGDDLLITALASKIKQKYPQRQIVIGIAEKKHAYHSPIYDHNPNISDCRNLLKNKPIVNKKVANAPKVIKPGVAKTESSKRNEVRNKISKLRKSGRIEDAHSAILGMITK